MRLIYHTNPHHHNKFPPPEPLKITPYKFWRQISIQWLGVIKTQLNGWDLVRGSTQRLWDSQFSKGGHVEDLGY